MIKKAIIISAAAVVILLGGITGYSIFKKSKKTEYKLENYTFEIDGSFKSKSDSDSRDSKTMKFSSRAITTLSVQGDGDTNLAAEYARDEFFADYDESGVLESISKSEVRTDDLTIYAVHMQYEKPCDEDHLCESVYIATKESKVFRMEAYYSPKNKEKALKQLDSIAETVKWSSNYKMPREPQNYEMPCLKLNNCPPCWKIEQKDPSAAVEYKKQTVCTIYDSDSAAKAYTRVNFYVFDPEKSGSAAEAADARYDKVSGTDAATHNSNIIRSQEEFCGRTAEAVTYETGDDDICWYLRYYFYDCEEGILCIYLWTDKNDHSADSMVEELIDSIEIK